MSQLRKKLLLALCFLAAIWVIVGLLMCSRENFRPHQFDIVTFFSDNDIPLDADKILYSDILPLQKTPIVLTSFILSENAWKKFVAFMQPYKSNHNTLPGISARDVLPYGNPVYNYCFKGHSIYIYDIQCVDNEKHVVIKCLIELSL